ncbi:MAG TPA: glycerate kinase [Myxococcaceae bacterium]|nr:glycerate kinase [Myxococcaceae bacterium]
MRYLVAPLEFKGSLTAAEAAQAMRLGLERGRPEAGVELLPLADGGPGTAQALIDALGGVWQTAPVHDPLGRRIEAAWGTWSEGRAGIVEMARASGLGLLAPGERNPRRASSFGTGELIRAAVLAGARSLMVGLGGSATNDGGAGALQALGVRLRDAQGRELPPGALPLRDLARIETDRTLRALEEVDIACITDVTNPLTGPSGATAVYGPQKGATHADIALLDAALEHLAEVVRRQLGMDIAHESGMGAAGGLGYGLRAVFGARIVPGFEHLARVLQLGERLARCDVVLTGEGRLDAQSLQGKGPVALAARARAVGRRVVMFAGSIEGTWAPGASPFDEIRLAGAPDWDERRADAREAASAALSAAVEAWAHGAGA